LRLKTYQLPSRIESRLESYALDVSRFAGARGPGTVITPSMVKSRQLIIAIPSRITAEQLGALESVVSYAAALSNPVSVRFVVVP
jgi:hypothetical protein